MLPESLPTTILDALTRTLRRRVIQRTRCTPLLATPAAREEAVSAVTASLHPRALLLGGEDPAHDLAGLDPLLLPPELPVAQEAGGGVPGRDGVHLGVDAP